MRFKDHPGLWSETWLAQSACGRYVISLNHDNPRLTQYEARWIDDERKRTWRIGRPLSTRVEAERACETDSLTIRETA
jgi:hypothetical protein